MFENSLENDKSLVIGRGRLSSAVLPCQDWINLSLTATPQKADYVSFFHQLAGQSAINSSRQKTPAMAERGKTLLTHDNAAGLSLACKRLTSGESRLTPLFVPAWDSAACGYVEGMIVYHVKKINSAIAERVSNRFMRYQVSRLLATLRVRSREPTNILIVNYRAGLSLACKRLSSGEPINCSLRRNMLSLRSRVSGSYGRTADFPLPINLTFFNYRSISHIPVVYDVFACTLFFCFIF